MDAVPNRCEKTNNLLRGAVKTRSSLCILSISERAGFPVRFLLPEREKEKGGNAYD